VAAFLVGLSRLAAADEVRGIGVLVAHVTRMAIFEGLAGPAWAGSWGAFPVRHLGKSFEPLFFCGSAEKRDAVLAGR
jgi:hypothetical protein